MFDTYLNSSINNYIGLLCMIGIVNSGSLSTWMLRYFPKEYTSFKFIVMFVLWLRKLDTVSIWYKIIIIQSRNYCKDIPYFKS